MIVKKKKLVVNTTYATTNGQPTVRERIEHQPVWYFTKAVVWIIILAVVSMGVRGAEQGPLGLPAWTNWLAVLVTLAFVVFEFRDMLTQKIPTVAEIDEKNREVAAEITNG